MGKITWSLLSRQDLWEIHDYIANDSPFHAQKTVKIFLSASPSWKTSRKSVAWCRNLKTKQSVNLQKATTASCIGCRAGTSPFCVCITLQEFSGTCTNEASICCCMKNDTTMIGRTGRELVSKNKKTGNKTHRCSSNFFYFLKHNGFPVSLYKCLTLMEEIQKPQRTQRYVQR